ncbi:hypothetical protein GAMM_40015 [Gammaproteobacteria bacterium]
MQFKNKTNNSLNKSDFRSSLLQKFYNINQDNIWIALSNILNRAVSGNIDCCKTIAQYFLPKAHINEVAIHGLERNRYSMEETKLILESVINISRNPEFQGAISNDHHTGLSESQAARILIAISEAEKLIKQKNNLA